MELTADVIKRFFKKKKKVQGISVKELVGY